MVLFELLDGAANKIELAKTKKFIKQLDLEYIQVEDQKLAFQFQAQYRLSHNVGSEDCLIAAVAERIQLPLYTINMKHFRVLIPTLAQKPY